MKIEFRIRKREIKYCIGSATLPSCLYIPEKIELSDSGSKIGSSKAPKVVSYIQKIKMETNIW